MVLHLPEAGLFGKASETSSMWNVEPPWVPASDKSAGAKSFETEHRASVCSKYIEDQRVEPQGLCRLFTGSQVKYLNLFLLQKLFWYILMMILIFGPQ